LSRPDHRNRVEDLHPAGGPRGHRSAHVTPYRVAQPGGARASQRVGRPTRAGSRAPFRRVPSSSQGLHRESHMAYASLLVQLDLEPSNDARLRVAGDFARRFPSHVIGIAAGDPNPPAYGGGKFAAGLIAQQRATIEQQLAAAQERFRAGLAGIGHMEWRQALDKPNAYVAAQARAADLVI